MVRPFETEIADDIATLWLSHPERRNAMGPEFWAELEPTIAKLDADESVRCVVLAAKGPHFSTGLDLVRMGMELGPALTEGGLAKERLALFRRILDMRRGFDRIVESDKPFVAAIHGFCIGGGLDMVSACDIRVASATARFAIRETKIALVADMGSLQRLEAIVGRGVLRELAFTGKDIDAARAQSIGLVNDVTATDDEVLARARSIAREIADNAPLVVQGTKRALRFTARFGEEAGLEQVAVWNAAQLASEDLREAMSAFVEKRPGKFRGR